MFMKTKTYHIYHHNDIDGHASGALVSLGLQEFGVMPEYIKYHRMDYGMPFDTSQIKYSIDTVYMVDFSLQPYERMLDLGRQLGHRLIWIDHHKTSKEFLSAHPNFKYEGIVKDGKDAACMLVWKWFWDNKIPPSVLKAASQYDVWDMGGKIEWDVVLALQMVLRNLETRTSQSLALWRDILFDNTDYWSTELWKTGSILQKFNQNRQKELAQSHAYEGQFCKHKAIIMNTAEGGSHQFEVAFDTTGYEMMVAYRLHRGEYWVVNLYSNNPNVDCGALAKRLGSEGPYNSGGGHRGAAGFQTSREHLFSLLPEEEES